MGNILASTLTCPEQVFISEEKPYDDGLDFNQRESYDRGNPRNVVGFRQM
jgi:hypothetical protein